MKIIKTKGKIKMSQAKNIIFWSLVFPIIFLLLLSKTGFPTAFLMCPLTYFFLCVHIPLVLLMIDHVKRNKEEGYTEIGTLPFWIVFTLLAGVLSVLSYWLFTYKLPNTNKNN